MIANPNLKKFEIFRILIIRISKNSADFAEFYWKDFPAALNNNNTITCTTVILLPFQKGQT